MPDLAETSNPRSELVNLVINMIFYSSFSGLQIGLKSLNPC